MSALVLLLFRFARLLLGGHAAVAVENAALRVQLDAFQRKRKRPVSTSLDRLFWVGLSVLWTGWRAPPVYVQADTVVRCQHERFRRFWARLSRVNQRRRGRPATTVEIRRLIERMACKRLRNPSPVPAQDGFLGRLLSFNIADPILACVPQQMREHINRK